MPRRVVGQITWAPEVFGYVMGEEDTTFDERDSAPFVPKGRVIDPAFTWGDDRPPNVPWDRTVLYETHVKGFTKLHPAVPEELRGTFRGLATPGRGALHQGSSASPASSCCRSICSPTTAT